MDSSTVRSASEQELRFIAARDYGQDAQRHFTALCSVCYEQGGIIQPDQIWFPYEVVELGSHSLVPGHEREFAICTLLVLANVAAGIDTATDLRAKLSDRAAEYDLLPAHLREEILHAYQCAEC